MMHIVIAIGFQVHPIARQNSASLRIKPVTFKVSLTKSKSLNDTPHFKINSEEPPYRPTAPSRKDSPLPPTSSIGEVYHPTNELDNPLIAIEDVDPNTDVVQDKSAYGKLVLVLWVAKNGAIDDVSVESSDLPQEATSEVVGAFRKIRFTPGRISNQVVKSVIRIEVEILPAHL